MNRILILLGLRRDPETAPVLDLSGNRLLFVWIITTMVVIALLWKFL